MKNIEEDFQSIDRSYLSILKHLLNIGDEHRIISFILDYDDYDPQEDYYMEELKKFAMENDIDSIEEMILSSNDYIDEYKFDLDSDDENFEEELYNSKGGAQQEKYEDEILSEDNEIASEINELNLDGYDGSNVNFEDLGEITEDDFDI